MAGKRCTTRGCPRIITDGNTRCREHRQLVEKQRGTRQQRGYDTSHDRERARWATILRTTPTPCARCGALIQPGEPFDLGHTDDRTGWTGPEHARCNRSAGGSAAHRP